MAERGLWRKTRDAFLTPITQVIPRILGALLGSGAETKYVILIMSQGTCLNLVCIWSCYFGLKHIGGGVIYKLIKYIEQNHSSKKKIIHLCFRLFILFICLYYIISISVYIIFPVLHICFVFIFGAFLLYCRWWGVSFGLTEGNEEASSISPITLSLIYGCWWVTVCAFHLFSVCPVSVHLY